LHLELFRASGRHGLFAHVNPQGTPLLLPIRHPRSEKVEMPNQAKANLSALIESTEDLIWSVNLDYRLIAFNSAFQKHIEDTFGVRPEVGMCPEDFAPPERAALWPPIYERVLREGPFRVEYPLLLSRILELSFNPIVVAGGTTGISVFGKDITERKAAESALKEAEKKYRDIFDGALEGIFQASLEGKSMAANPALARMLGYDSPQELQSSIKDLGKDVWVDPDERTRYLQMVKEQGAGAVLGYECRLKRKDGTVIWVSLNGRLVCAADGTPLRNQGFIIDITERKRAEESLRESGDFLKEAQMLGFLGCYVLDIPSGVWTSSDVLDGIFGIDREYARTIEGWMALIHPHDSAMMAAYFQNEVVARGKPFDKEYRIIRQADQAERWVHGTGSLEFDAQGRPLRMHGIIQDITEPRLAEMKLRESELRYRTAFQTVPEAVIIARVADGTIIDANQAFLDSSGYERDEVVGRTTLELGIWIDPSDRQRLRDALTRNGECRDLEVRSRRKDGEIFWMRLSASLIEIGGSQCMLTFAKNISEARAAEERLAAAMEALRLSEAHYRTVFQTSVDGIALSQMSDGKYIDANAAFLHLMGYERDEIIGRTSLELNFWFDKGDRQKMLAALREYSSLRDMQIQHVRKNGEIIWILVSATTIEIDGNLCMISVIQDISAAKAAEQRLAAAAEALRASEKRYRTAFLMNIDSVDICHLEDGRFIDVNDAFLASMGFERDEVIGRTALELGIWANPGDRKQLLETMRLNKSCRNMEAQYRTKDGRLRWALLSVSAIELDGLPCILSVTRDITDAKAAEQRLAAAQEALRESEARYRSTFEQAAIGIVHASFDGRILLCNARFAAILGYGAGELSGINVQQVTAEEDRPANIEAMQRLLDDATVNESLEKRYLRKDGSPTWVTVTLSIQRDGGGRALHFIAVVEDINARKTAEDKLAAAQEALRGSEARYRAAFQISIDEIAISQVEDGRYLDVSQAFLDARGFQREEVIGRTSLELNIWEDPRDRDSWIELMRRDSVCRDLEVRLRRKNGEAFWGQLSASLIELDGVPCILSFTRDITPAKAAMEALRASEERYRATFQSSIDAININRMSDGVFVDVNEAFLRFVGFERWEVIGRTSRELNFWVDPDDRQRMIETLRQNGSCRDLQARFRRKNGDIVWGQLSSSIIEADGVPCMLSVTRDISAAKAAEEQIRDLAFYDSLTHLPNRSLLMERLRQSLAASSRTNRKRALLFVDLDNFKILNDTLGHRTGDLMLQEVAVRLAACIRDADTVARLGGDEFVVMLENLSDVPEDAAAQAEIVGEKILAAIDQPFWLAGRECLSTSSIGITVFGDKRESTDEVLQQADIAMYQAKAAGRNTMRFFAPALQAAVNARVVLEEDIRQAIKASQFVLYYQPQLDSIGLVGAEALIRWNHPRRGLLLPGEFIPLAEETGLIQPLGDWGLETACAQVAAWADRPETAHISLAINISARQFRQPGFVDKVLAALYRTGANPQNIKLELTESMLVENIEDIIAKMTLLKSHGLKFSLDDFGTGYSSLAYLKRLPLDQLKIDSSFVRDIAADIGSRAIAQSVISLGRALGLSVIAECVETEEQRAFLSRLGCHAFQGFLFSQPLPLAEFERLWLPSSAFSISVAG